MSSSLSPIAAIIHPYALICGLFQSSPLKRVNVQCRCVAQSLAAGAVLCAEHNPELLILGTDFPDGDGWDFIYQLRPPPAGPKVLVLVSAVDDYTAIRANESPATSVFEASSGTYDLCIDVVETVLAGGHFRSQSLRSAIARLQQPGSWLRTLGRRQITFLRHFGRALPDSVIADEMGMKLSSVLNLRDRLREKLGLKSAFELFQWASAAGFVRPPFVAQANSAARPNGLCAAVVASLT